MSQRTCTTRTNGRKTLREHRCGAGQKLSEGQVRIRPLGFRGVRVVNSSYLDLRESYPFYSSGEVAFLLDLQIFPMWDSDPLSLIGS